MKPMDKAEFNSASHSALIDADQFSPQRGPIYAIRTRDRKTSMPSMIFAVDQLPWRMDRCVTVTGYHRHSVLGSWHPLIRAHLRFTLRRAFEPTRLIFHLQFATDLHCDRVMISELLRSAVPPLLSLQRSAHDLFCRHASLLKRALFLWKADRPDQPAIALAACWDITN